MSKTSSENIDELHFHEREAELFKLILKQLSTSQDYLESSQKHQNTLQNYQITC